MLYRVFQPSPSLQPYIDRYWFLSGFWPQEERVTVMPDGGTHLVLNLGEDIRSLRFQEVVKSEGLLLVGTMLQWDEQVLRGESRLFGIQFKPGAFTHFYRWESMGQAANQVQAFSRNLFPDLKKTIPELVSCADDFYLKRLSPPKQSLLSVVADIERHGGQVRLDALAKRHFTTERQLERQFQQQIGVSPKEFLNLTRFNRALEKIQQQQHRSLSDIAWDCGYYDHAHLSNDFKRYTGTTPTSLILSDFSKTVA